MRRTERERYKQERCEGGHITETGEVPKSIPERLLLLFRVTDLKRCKSVISRSYVVALMERGGVVAACLDRLPLLPGSPFVHVADWQTGLLPAASESFPTRESASVDTETV